MVSYAATKHAVVGLSTSHRGEAGPQGIRVSVLCPAFIRTPILENGGRYGKTIVELSAEQQQIIAKMVEKLKPIEPVLFARKALNGIAKNKAVIVLPKSYHLYCMIRIAHMLRQSRCPIGRSRHRTSNMP